MRRWRAWEWTGIITSAFENMHLNCNANWSGWGIYKLNQLNQDPYWINREEQHKLTWQWQPTTTWETRWKNDSGYLPSLQFGSDTFCSTSDFPLHTKLWNRTWCYLTLLLQNANSWSIIKMWKASKIRLLQVLLCQYTPCKPTLYDLGLLMI